VSARRTQSVGIFAVEWSNRSKTIVTASDTEEAHHFVQDSKRDALDDMLEAGSVRVPILIPVTRLEIGVGPRRHRNAPTFCRLSMGARSIAWTTPGKETRHKGLADGAEARRAASPSRVWSYVWQERELVFFDAPDRESACDHAVARAPTWGFGPATRRLVSDNIEPVERLEIRLRPPSFGSAPRGYWAWVQGVKVGWPQVEPEESGVPAPAPPDSEGEPPAIHALPPFLRYIG